MKIDLSLGGNDWLGWEFGKYGKAKNWRLLAPNGAVYCAIEILELHRMALDLDYLQVQVKILRAQLEPGAIHFSPYDAATLRAAAAILTRAMPRAPVRQTACLVEVSAGSARRPLSVSR